MGIVLVHVKSQTRKTFIFKRYFRKKCANLRLFEWLFRFFFKFTPPPLFAGRRKLSGGWKNPLVRVNFPLFSPLSHHWSLIKIFCRSLTKSCFTVEQKIFSPKEARICKAFFNDPSSPLPVAAITRLKTSPSAPRSSTLNTLVTSQTRLHTISNQYY